MRINTFLLIVIALSFSCCDKHDSSKKLIVAISAQYPPITYADGSEIKGFDIDLVRMIGKRMNLEVEFKDMKFQSIFPALNSSEADLAVGCISSSEERKKNFDFSTVYRYEDLTLVFRKDSKIEDIYSIGDYKIGVQFGSTRSTWARNHLHPGNIVEMDNTGQLINALKNRIIDGILTSKSHGIEFESKMQILGFSIITEDDESGACSVIFKKNSKLLPKINEILNEMIKNRDIEKLEEKWGL